MNQSGWLSHSADLVQVSQISAGLPHVFVAMGQLSSPGLGWPELGWLTLLHVVSCPPELAPHHGGKLPRKYGQSLWSSKTRTSPSSLLPHSIGQSESQGQAQSQWGRILPNGTDTQRCKKSGTSNHSDGARMQTPNTSLLEVLLHSHLPSKSLISIYVKFHLAWHYERARSCF